MGVPQKLKIELSYDPEIPVLGIHLKKMKTLIQKDTCTSMFIAALFTIAKVQKQPVSSNRQMDKKDVAINIYIYIHIHIYTYTIEY